MARHHVVQQLQPKVWLPEYEWRKTALSVIHRFKSFARDACGCTATSNRANVRRAVFHATQDLDLDPFINNRLNGDVSALESIARMECPVTLPTKGMLKVKVKESSPKRIIFASKALRRHFSITETHSCRNCHKRQRCGFFKAPAEEDVTTGVRHVGRVLFGMSQYARAHLEKPEVYPLFFTEHNVQSAFFLINALEKELAEESTQPLYNDIELASEETAREALVRQAQKMVEAKKRRAEEKLLGIPLWMRETLQPVVSKSMGKRQRDVLAKSGLNKHDDDDDEGEKSKDAEDKNPEELWVEEGSTAGEPAMPLVFDPSAQTGGLQASSEISTPVADNEIISLDEVNTLPIPQRFKHIQRAKQSRPVRNFNSVMGVHTAGIHVLDSQELSYSINLDEVAKVGAEDIFSTKSELRAGYMIADLINSDNFRQQPQEVCKLLSLSSSSLEGVQRYSRVRGGMKNGVNPRTIEKLWQRTEAGEEELPFMTRVPFDISPGSSGGSLPPKKLPKDKLAPEPEPWIEAPRQHSFPVDMSPGKQLAPEMQNTHSEHEFVELDEHLPPSSETIEADEELAAMALGRRAGRRFGRKRSLSASKEPGQEVSAVSDLQAPDEEAKEDNYFARWKARTAGKHFGVIDPNIDFSGLGDPGRLSQVHAREPETHITPASLDPLPHDEEFTTTFKRPLVDPSGTDTGDPLGSAAPNIDIGAIKASASRTGPSATIERQSGYIVGGDVKFPAIPERRQSTQSPGKTRHPPAVKYLPPRMGALKQAHIGDLDDLVKPGALASRNSLGEVSHPDKEDLGEGANLQHPRSQAMLREERNSSKAAQILWHKGMKEKMKQRFPPATKERPK